MSCRRDPIRYTFQLLPGVEFQDPNTGEWHTVHRLQEVYDSPDPKRLDIYIADGKLKVTNCHPYSLWRIR